MEISSESAVLARELGRLVDVVMSKALEGRSSFLTRGDGPPRSKRRGSVGPPLEEVVLRAPGLIPGGTMDPERDERCGDLELSRRRG